MFSGLCATCSNKLNYKHKRKEVKRNKISKSIKGKSKHLKNNETSDIQLTTNAYGEASDASKIIVENNVWSEQLQIEDDKPREDDFEDYLEQLLF